MNIVELAALDLNVLVENLLKKEVETKMWVLQSFAWVENSMDKIWQLCFVHPCRFAKLTEPEGDPF